LIVHVDETGKPVSVEEPTGPDWVCPQAQTAEVVAIRNAAKAAAMKTRFKPGTENGVAVPSTATLKFEIGSSGPLSDPDYYSSHPYVGSKEDRMFAVVGEKNDPATKDLPAANRAPSENQSESKTPPKTLTAGVLNGKAMQLPPPRYPAAARAVKATGKVPMQVLIDTDGKVLSAKPLSGHPLLQSVSRDAACKASFMPTLLSGQPVRVSGIITYNFVP
jgi:TonB family protein